MEIMIMSTPTELAWELNEIILKTLRSGSACPEKQAQWPSCPLPSLLPSLWLLPLSCTVSGGKSGSVWVTAKWEEYWGENPRNYSLQGSNNILLKNCLREDFVDVCNLYANTEDSNTLSRDMALGRNFKKTTAWTTEKPSSVSLCCQFKLKP